MFLVRDFSKENLKKEQPIYQTLRACTSEKRLAVFPPPNQYLRVGSYKYREQDLLGKGFSSKVYKAVHINNSQERYAIKVINLKKFKASNIAMLQSQIEVHRTLSHPNIVQFYDAYKTQNVYYIITEYCPHGDLMQLINQKKKLQESKAQSIIQQIIEGYNYLSKKFILHRDLKPANIFRNGETWKIGDFGFSMVCKGESFFDKINVGTPLYMPLQSLKTNKYSVKSDIFAIGIILYQMITGRTPWECKTEKQLVNKMKTQSIKYPQLKNQQIRRLISRACEVNEVDRISINDVATFFSTGCNSTNPQQKQNQCRKTLKNALSMKNIRQSIKLPMTQTSKNTTFITVCSKEVLPSHANIYEQSTQVSQKSDSNRNKNKEKQKQKENYSDKNTRLLLQQLQFCRLIYYMTKNMKYFPILDGKVKNFINLTLFKHLLRSIKQLEEPNLNFNGQLINFQAYQNEKEYKRLQQQIKSYSKRYQKQYLDVLKNTQISIIRAVNKKFPQLSYNSSLGQLFYRNYYEYFCQMLRLLNHGVSANENNETDKQLLSAGYQSVESFYSYCQVIQEKMVASEVRKCQVFTTIGQKVVMDYKLSKLQRIDYQSLRQRIKAL